MAPDLAPNGYFDVARPIRVPRGRLVKEDELEKAVRLASMKAGAQGLVIVLLDADDDCPAELGPAMLTRACTSHPPQRTSVVLANREFEAWYLAASDSIAGQRGLPSDFHWDGDPEGPRDAKGLLSAAMPGGMRYSETIDQPGFAAIIDLQAARTAPSFDKLYRDLDRMCAD